MTNRGVGLGSRRGPGMERSMGKGRGWRGEEGTKSGGNEVGQKGREGREMGEEERNGAAGHREAQRGGAQKV